MCVGGGGSGNQTRDAIIIMLKSLFEYCLVMILILIILQFLDSIIWAKFGASKMYLTPSSRVSLFVAQVLYYFDR